LYDELLPTLNLPEDELKQYASDVLDRFRNPFVKHFVTSIMLNSFSKYKTRDLPGLKIYRERTGRLPAGLVLGLAGIVTYYKGGKRGEEELVLHDDPAILATLSGLWQSNDVHEVAKGVLSSEYIWGEDLNRIDDLTGMLSGYLRSIQEKGMLETVKDEIFKN
jgi:tagaturonate reductase